VKFASLLSLIVLLMMPLAAQNPPVIASNNDPAPYIYYYSGALNGIVIERADGTDSRIIGQGLVDEDVEWINGPGWSADGRWFAWRNWSSYYGAVYPGKGYAISADGKAKLDMLANLPSVTSILWHPTENTLLVYSLNRVSRLFPIASYWLIDANTQTRLATFSIDSWVERGSPSAPAIYWHTDQKQIQFFESTSTSGSFIDYQYFLVTMSYDGTVMMTPITLDEFDAEPQGDTLSSNAFGEYTHTEFTRWSETLRVKAFSVPSNSSAALDITAGGQWDSSGKWLFVGYEFCFTDCAEVIGQVSIFNPATGYSREIANCGAHPTCVGWLPERVNISDLPPGKPTSVLPTPKSMDYDLTFMTMGDHNKAGRYGYFPETATHELVCDQGRLSDVRNKTTGNTDFVLQDGEPCGKPLQLEPEIVYPTQPIIFALSPDKKYYAITDSSEYTALYDADTGNRIARMNFYGIELSFSADSPTLITMGRYATATWDIQELVANALDTP
jgi:hypothetical protein